MKKYIIKCKKHKAKTHTYFDTFTIFFLVDVSKFLNNLLLANFQAALIPIINWTKNYTKRSTIFDTVCNMLYCTDMYFKFKLYTTVEVEI